MAKPLLFLVAGILALGAVLGLILYTAEVRRNDLLRSENSKTVEEAQAEIKKIKEETRAEHDRDSDDRRKLLEQVTAASKERDEAIKAKEDLQKRFSNEREASAAASDDLTKVQTELIKIKKESRQEITHVQDGFKKKLQGYEARILSAEAQLEKIRERLAKESERYHYNLGVIYTQTKDFDNAVTEFKAALAYNPKNAQAHYNLGILYDDYFKDKENARYHYSAFLDLSPNSDDAEAVREWLGDINKKSR